MASSAPPPPPRPHARTLILFDVDGTLCVPAQRAAADMVALLARNCH